MLRRNPTEIYIGGEVPVGLIPSLCFAISGEQFTLGWGGEKFEPVVGLHFEVNLIESGQLHLCNPRALGVANLESLLRGQGVHFTRILLDTCKVFEFRGEDLIPIPLGDDGEVVVPVHKIRPVAKLIEDALQNFGEGKPATSVRLLRDAEQALQEALPPEIEPLNRFTFV